MAMSGTSSVSTNTNEIPSPERVNTRSNRNGSSAVTSRICCNDTSTMATPVTTTSNSITSMRTLLR